MTWMYQNFRKPPNRCSKMEIMRNNGIQADFGLSGAMFSLFENKAASSHPFANWFTIRLAESWQNVGSSEASCRDFPVDVVKNWKNPYSNGLSNGWKRLIYSCCDISQPTCLSHIASQWIPGHGALGLCLAEQGHETCRDGPLQRLQRWWTRPLHRRVGNRKFNGNSTSNLVNIFVGCWVLCVAQPPEFRLIPPAWIIKISWLPRKTKSEGLGFKLNKNNQQQYFGTWLWLIMHIYIIYHIISINQSIALCMYIYIYIIYEKIWVHILSFVGPPFFQEPSTIWTACAAWFRPFPPTSAVWAWAIPPGGWRVPWAIQSHFQAVYIYIFMCVNSYHCKTIYIYVFVPGIYIYTCIYLYTNDIHMP